MEVHWASTEPGRQLVRMLTVPLGVESWARTAARRMGWAPPEPLKWIDSDGLALGGFIPREH